MPLLVQPLNQGLVPRSEGTLIHEARSRGMRDPKYPALTDWIFCIRARVGSNLVGRVGLNLVRSARMSFSYLTFESDGVRIKRLNGWMASDWIRNNSLQKKKKERKKWSRLIRQVVTVDPFSWALQIVLRTMQSSLDGFETAEAGKTSAGHTLHNNRERRLQSHR